MSWTLFEGKGRTPLGYLPRVAVHKAGRMSLNEAAFHAMGEPDYVDLLFDREAGRIGLRRAHPDDRHAYALKKPNGSSRYYVSAKSFISHLGLDVPRMSEYEAAVEGGGILAIKVELEGAAADGDIDPDDLIIAPSAPSGEEIDPDDIPF